MILRRTPRHRRILDRRSRPSNCRTTESANDRIRAFRSLLVGLLAGLLPPDASIAGPNAGGTLLLHFDPTIGTCEVADCPPLDLVDCESALVRVEDPLPCPTGMWVLAAFPEDASPRLAGATFGWSYDPSAIGIQATLSCADFELPTGGWPGTGEGNAVVWNVPRTESIVPVYWFLAYLYEGAGPSHLTLSPHPVQGAFFADDSVPSVLDIVTGLGSLGFETDGEPACPDGSGPPGACCLPDASCLYVAEEQCDDSGGFYAGPYLECEPNPCLEVDGTCCLPTMGCRLRTLEECEDANGDFLGYEVPCDPDPCPPLVGACCLPDLSCAVLRALECYGADGGYLGHGYPCDPDPCALLTGCPGPVPDLDGSRPGDFGADEAAGPAVRIGSADGTVVGAPVGDPPPDGSDLLFHADGSYENGYAFGTFAQVPPWFGAFAECYSDPREVGAAVFDFAALSDWSDSRMDVYVWSDLGGCPGAVVGARLSVDPGPIAHWPDISRHVVALDPICPGDTWWIGYWGDWQGGPERWFVAADLNGPGGGCPYACFDPSSFGDDGGWNDVSVVWGSTRALGIGAYVTECDPTPVVGTTWGRLKQLFR